VCYNDINYRINYTVFFVTYEHLAIYSLLKLRNYFIFLFFLPKTGPKVNDTCCNHLKTVQHTLFVRFIFFLLFVLYSRLVHMIYASMCANLLMF